MENILDWSRNREMWIRVLEKQTGKGLEHWKRRVRKENFDEAANQPDVHRGDRCGSVELAATGL